MLWLPLCSLSAILLYQATNPALYYLIGTIVYFWAYCEGEVSCAMRCEDVQTILTSEIDGMRGPLDAA
jgi:hypothetical protein